MTRTKHWSSIRSIVPFNTSGNWSVEEFEITRSGAAMHNLRCSLNPERGMRTVKSGKHTKLVHGQTIVMSDTPAEIMDLAIFRHYAMGDVLINGLGLGIALQVILAKPNVTSVTVIENSFDVHTLVAPHFKDKRLTIILADAFKWVPPRGTRYNAVWHDIWNVICADNLPEMRTLHRKYGRRSDWQASWCRHLL